MKEKDEGIRKHDRVLAIHTRLMSGESIRKRDLSEEYGVSTRSIQRDIDSIREFYSNRTISNGEFAEIRYDHTTKGYRLFNDKSVTLTNAELFAAAKIILESRSLSKKEMERIITNLMRSCPPATERKKMALLVGNELYHYVEPRHGKDIVDTIWDIGTAVSSHHKMQMKYLKTNGEITDTLIKPVSIMESEYYFYLIAYVGDKDKKYPGYPTVYRIDRIVNYNITDDVFFIPEKERFKEGEFRKRIPFMYTGKLHRTKFIYRGTDINAILDRLPTARATQLEDGTYMVSAEVYGDKGLNMWIKGQPFVELIPRSV